MLIVISLAAAAISFWYFFINIYETELKCTVTEPDRALLVIEAVPLNGFGHKAFFRSAKADFTIDKGSEIVRIISLDENKGAIEIKPLPGASGRMEIIVNTKYSLMPERRGFNIISGRF